LPTAPTRDGVEGLHPRTLASLASDFVAEPSKAPVSPLTPASDHASPPRRPSLTPSSLHGPCAQPYEGP
ncbi:hypothetical protein NGA_0319600, partial [Nannochloropsis gaditana CCMP526]|uniref:uncharacterized protein n=1 Tax=Nannochloropsis gaditana (strain CCMP526) TaxID=1093141 RepID=UPI00029F7923